MNPDKKPIKKKRIFFKFLKKQGSFDKFKRLYRTYQKMPLDFYLHTIPMSEWVACLTMDKKQAITGNDYFDIANLHDDFKDFLNNKRNNITNIRAIIGTCLFSLLLFLLIFSFIYFIKHEYWLIALLMVVLIALAIFMMIFFFNKWVNDHGIYSND